MCPRSRACSAGSAAVNTCAVARTMTEGSQGTCKACDSNGDSSTKDVSSNKWDAGHSLYCRSHSHFNFCADCFAAGKAELLQKMMRAGRQSALQQQLVLLRRRERPGKGQRVVQTSCARSTMRRWVRSCRRRRSKAWDRTAICSSSATLPSRELLVAQRCK